jgi:hypothetical protein
LHISAINESDDTLQASASAAERATPMVYSVAVMDDDDGLYNDLGCQTNKDSSIDNDSGPLSSQISDEDPLEVAPRNWLMLEMLLDN